MLRSTLFLTCLTAILNFFQWLDWVDVLALKFLKETEFEQNVTPGAAPPHVLVLGITPDLFEHEFGGHTPINRDRFADLIEAVLQAYPKLRVLAVDYDFSPNATDPCADKAERSVCAIAKVEAEQQRRFEEFLRTRFGGDKPSVRLALIAPLDYPEEYASSKQKWLCDMARAGVRFGDHSLLYHNWLATVVKHRQLEARDDPCVSNAAIGTPLASVVNQARADAKLPLPTRSDEPQEVALINFAKAREATFLCPLWEWRDIVQGCQQRLALGTQRTPAQAATAIDTIFIGSSYGQEDKFRTPLGDQYGVELHAFGAFSQLTPLRDPKFLAFAMDLAIGMLSAFVFQALWSGAVRARHRPMQRFGYITLVFVVLLAAAWAVLWLTPTMLRSGMWMNPLMILVGLFIDSYAGAIEHVGASAAEPEAHSPGNALRDFLGLPQQNLEPVERAFVWGKKVVFYWGVVLTGLLVTLLG